MRVSRHFCFRIRLHPAMALYVMRSNIAFKQVDDTDFIMFDIFEDDPHWPALQALLEADGDRAIATRVLPSRSFGTPNG